MYAAVLTISGYGKYYIDGNTPEEIIRKFEDIQDLNCLCMMGLANERSKKNIASLNKLQEFISKYECGNLDMKDIADLEVTTRIGSIFCDGIATGEKEAEDLKNRYSSATAL